VNLWLGEGMRGEGTEDLEDVVCYGGKRVLSERVREDIGGFGLGDKGWGQFPTFSLVKNYLESFFLLA